MNQDTYRTATRVPLVMLHSLHLDLGMQISHNSMSEVPVYEVSKYLYLGR